MRIPRILTLFFVSVLLGGAVSVSLYGETAPAFNKLDPTLRHLLIQQRITLAKTGRALNLAPYADRIEVISSQDRMVPTASLGEPSYRLAVLIRAQDPAQLQRLGVRPRAIAGEIATAHLTLDQLTKLTQSSNVIYIEASKRLRPAQLPLREPIAQPELNLSVPDTGATLLHQQGITGRGVIVGMIDTGIDCTHKDFRTERNWNDSIDEESTRLLALLDQTMNNEYGPSRIEDFIRTEAFCPTSDDDLAAPGHGTQVMGIAAGDGSSSMNGYAGMAPEADLIAVKSTLSDAGLIEGARYIFERAGSRPTVINLSVGTHKGPHDGTSNLELALDALVGPPGRALVVAAGNQGDEQIHVGGLLFEGIRDRFEIAIDPQKVPSEMGFDFWYDSQLNLNAYVISPTGNRVGPVSTRQMHTENTNEGGVRIDNASLGLSPNNGANHMEIAIYGLPIAVASGTWVIELESAGGAGGRYDGWAVDLPFTSSNADSNYTIASPGSARRLISVGAHVTRDHWQSESGQFFSFPKENPIGQIASFSSRGPTRDNRLKPELTAPGVAIASSLAESARRLLSVDFILLDRKHTIARGTSFSAPHVTGAVALLLQQEPKLTIQQIKDKLTQWARSDQFTGPTPNQTWGTGKLWVGSLSGVNPKPIPTEIRILARQLDRNANGQLDDEEVLDALDAWVNSRPPLGVSRLLTDTEMLGLLNFWQQSART
jgi:subtilisin family serine protease